MPSMSQAPSSASQHRPVELAGWARVQTVYAFCRARAIDRIIEAEQSHSAMVARQRRDLHILETMYGKARHNDVVASCAVTYFRMTAMRDARHPDFLGEWI